MLTSAQKKKIAKLLNKKIDIPILPKALEEQIFEQAVNFLDEQLDRHLPQKFKDLIENEDQGIDGMHVGQLKKNLIKKLNKKIDIPLVGEKKEKSIIKFFVNILFKAIMKNTNIDKVLGNN